MRYIYTLLFYLITPFAFFRLYWRGFKAPEYRKRWAERLAIYRKKLPHKVIWIHAVSVGEAEAVFPLVKRLQKHYSSDHFLVTTTTPTGSSRVQEVLGNTVSHVYLPYDLPCVIKRFLSAFRPKIAVFMEKEIWPNLYAQCADNNISIVIINARLSDNSAKAYQKIPSLFKPALDKVSWIATQTEEDKERFIAIGAKEKFISSEGNLKFDLEFDGKIVQQAQAIKNKLFPSRFIWIVASTHEGEEKIFFDIYPELKKKIPALLLMIVPRHPERFTAVQKISEQMGLTSCMRSKNQPVTTMTDVYIVDTVGELKTFYATAEISFVGGSMVPVGGHNILEPAALGVPITFGPFMVNFKEITKNMLDLKAAVQCMNKNALVDTTVRLHDDVVFRKELSAKAKQFVTNNQGSTDKIARLISDMVTGNK